MRRRDFIAGLGGAASSAFGSLTARAQQPGMPVIGFLDSSWRARTRPGNIAGFQRGLADEGYVEGRNLSIQYRWAEGRNDLLPTLAADLVGLRVAVIVTNDTPATLAAKAATQTVPIVFGVGTNPVEDGLVENLSRPGGNATGITNLASEVSIKRLQMLHEAVPQANPIALLVNPTNIRYEDEARQLSNAARSLGVRLLVLRAARFGEIGAVFGRLVEDRLVEERATALLVSADPLFFTYNDQIVPAANHYAIPTSFDDRVSVLAGGLMSYGTNFYETSRIVGAYTGRILKGEKPGNLPVQQSAKIEFVVNLKTAKALGLTIPLTLLARADEVIE